MTPSLAPATPSGPEGAKGYVYARLRNGEQSTWTRTIPDFQAGDTILCKREDGR